MEKVTHGKMNSRVRGSFHSLERNQTIRWVRGEGKEREKKKEKKEKRFGQCVIRERGERDLQFSSRSSANRRLKLVGVRGKLGLWIRATLGY